MSLHELTTDQLTAVASRKFVSAANGLKSIVDAGRAADRDPTKILYFRGAARALDSTYAQIQAHLDTLLDLYLLKNSDAPPEHSLDDSRRRYNEASALLLKFEAPPPSQSQPSVPAELRDSDSTFLNTSQPNTRARLPQIHLPQFNGILAEWPMYRDTYVSLIHEDLSMTLIEKFHYLIGTLSGPPLALLRSVPLLEANYTQAWQLLIDRYDNKRKLAASYLSQILAFQTQTGKATISSLQAYISTISQSITAFNNLKISNAADYILFELAVRRLDPVTRESFEISNTTEFPTFTQLSKFVKDRCGAMVLASDLSTDTPSTAIPSKAALIHQSPNKFQPKPPYPTRATFLAHTSDSASAATESTQYKLPLSCFVCSKRHVLKFCQRFNEMTPHERVKSIKRWQGCHNCLHPGHRTDQCPSTWTCQVCGERHHTRLHLPESSNVVQTENKIKENPRASNISPSQKVPDAATSLASTSTDHTAVLLGTALARVQDLTGKYHPIRLVVDCGSQYSFITQSCVKMLGITPLPFNRRISGVGQSVLNSIRGQIECTLGPLGRTTPTISTVAIVVPSITPPLPQTPVPQSIWTKYSAFELADPGFWTPASIDCLLGADAFMEIMTGPPVPMEMNEPQLLPTMFGYIVIGKFPQFGSSATDDALSCAVVETESVTELLGRFWEIEEVSKPLTLSNEDQHCELHFTESHYRLPSGRYVVALPFKRGHVNLPLAKQRVLSRLYNLESKLSKNTDLRHNYHAFLQEYIDLGHMRKTNIPASYVIPHHSVVKMANNMMKIRVVFDGSAKTIRGSLNDNLLVGPKLQNEISSILQNFRRFSVVFTADIVKMYRQIGIKPEDRHYQHIFWRFNPQLQVDEYELTTLTYGLSCSPFLALRVIKQLIEDEGHHFPLAANTLLDDVYVDDIVTGAHSLDEAKTLKSQIISLLAKGAFELSKWASNAPELLPSTDLVSSPIELQSSEDTSIKVLGLQWDPVSDTFAYKITLPDHPIFTKRAILSTIARIFDPLGYLSPVVFHAKIIMQQIWIAGTGWDEPVSPEIEHSWQEFIQELPRLNSVSIPRYLGTNTQSQHDVYGFCDASSKGYCATVYLRVTKIDDAPHLFLLQAKTKLAPIKTVSIPRLELLGALLLSRLYQSLLPFFAKLQVKHTTFFTDSTIVLSWLRIQPIRLKTFVANRVTEILEHTNIDNWRHISTQYNPADCGTRGLMPSELITHSLWWKASPWLTQPESSWPAVSIENPTGNLPEMKNVNATLGAFSGARYDDLLKWMERFSNYLRLTRSFAFALRFVSNCKFKRTNQPLISGPLSSSDVNLATKICVSILQKFYYPEAFTDNKGSLKLLQCLNCFVDEEGILRVGGRLQHAALDPETKFPMLLPRRCHFNNLLIDYHHRLCCHAGPNTVFAHVAQLYWIPAVKSLIKQRTHRCFPCFKLSTNPKVPFMGNLPPARVGTLKAFNNTGVDFAGPFLTKESNRRKAPQSKSYLGLFICMATKAVHLELVSNLSTEAFLNAFDRFTARRGLPLKMYSDCGSNFIGASNYFKEMENAVLNGPTARSKIVDACSAKGIAWSFIPPRSPNFGGLWEAGVKVAKTLLLRTFGNHLFTVEELATAFTRIEAIMNSRPLVPMSTNPSDLNALTPGHFLIGQPLMGKADPDLTGLPENRLSRWQLVRQRIQQFWDRWRNEYLLTLQRRAKWTERGPDIEPGELVLLHESAAFPLSWPLARVTAVHPGTDKIVRVVTLKTAHSTFKRPVSKLVSLTPFLNDCAKTDD